MRLMTLFSLTTFISFAMASFFGPSSSDTSALAGPPMPYYPESKFETFGGGLDISNISSEPFDLNKTSIAFTSSHYNIPSSDLVYKSGYEDDITKHAFVVQAINGTPFINTEAHVTYNKQNKVVSASSSLVTITPSVSIASPDGTIPPQAAIAAAEAQLNGTYTKPPANTDSVTTSAEDNDTVPLGYLSEKDGSATLVYVIQVKNDAKNTWYEGYINAHNGSLAAATNFVSS